MKTFKTTYNESKLTEAKMTASKLVKLFKNKEDWGDMGETTRVVKGNLEVVDTWYYGQDAHMDDLITTWTTPNGSTAKYLKDEYGISFKLVDKFTQHKAQGRYKKITTNGIVGIILKIV